MYLLSLNLVILFGFGLGQTIQAERTCGDVCRRLAKLAFWESPRLFIDCAIRNCQMKEDTILSQQQIEDEKRFTAALAEKYCWKHVVRHFMFSH